MHMAANNNYKIRLTLCMKLFRFAIVVWTSAGCWEYNGYWCWLAPWVDICILLKQPAFLYYKVLQRHKYGDLPFQHGDILSDRKIALKYDVGKRLVAVYGNGGTDRCGSVCCIM